jgi:hypothetical protein
MKLRGINTSPVSFKPVIRLSEELISFFRVLRLNGK